MMRIKRITFSLDLNDPGQKVKAEFLRKQAGANRLNLLRLLLIIGSADERRKARSGGDL